MDLSKYTSSPFDSGNYSMTDGTQYSVKNLAIGAQVICINFMASDAVPKSQIKYDLAKKLANYIIDNKLAEFTFQEDPITMNVKYNVRCYLAKDSDIKILRTYGVVS